MQLGRQKGNLVRLSILLFFTTQENRDGFQTGNHMKPSDYD